MPEPVFGPYFTIEGPRKLADYIYNYIDDKFYSYRTLNGGKGGDRLYAVDNAHDNIFNGNEGPDELWAQDNAHRNSFNGGEGSDELKAWDNAHHNILNGDAGGDVLVVEGNAHHNTLNGGAGDYGDAGDDVLVAGDDDELVAADNAYHNTLNGGAGDYGELKAWDNAHHNILNGDAGVVLVGGGDELVAADNAHHNILNGGAGRDVLVVKGNAHHNILNGDAGDDLLVAGGDRVFAGNAHHNTLNGGAGRDVLVVKGNAHHNILNGGAGDDVLVAGDDDELVAVDNAHHNTLNGGAGRDVLVVKDKACSTIVNGGEDDDFIVSTRGGTLQGETGNDFILTYLPDGNLFRDDDSFLTMTGGDGHDVLIGSGLFWQAQKQEFEDILITPPSWTLDAGVGDDIIMPYIALEKIGIYGINKALQNNINDFKQKITAAKMYKPFDGIRDTNYHITTGEGEDIVALSSKPAKNVTTQIKDFNWDEDRLAFDSVDMAEAILPELAWAKALSITKVDLNYKGHHYALSKDNRQNQMPVEIKTAEVDGMKVQYPDLGENFELSYDYRLYDAKAVAGKMASIKDPRQFKKALFGNAFIQKTFSKTYTIKLEKNNFVTTKTALNLTPNEKGVLQVKLGAHLSGTVVSFRARDLFAGENTHTCLYQNLATNKVLYFKTPERQDMPENIAAVVVVQEKNQGLIFTTQPEQEKVTVAPTTQIFTASDFFRKGHFAMADGHNNDQQKSVTMRLGLVLKGKDNNLITTPLSDPIHITVGK